MTDKTEVLRHWARGIHPVEAAVELLVRPFNGRFAQPGNPWVGTDPDGSAWIEWRVIPESIGPLSGGERRLLLMAASLGCGNPVDLGEVSGLDQPRLDLLLAAIAHAGGCGHLHPWPATTEEQPARTF